MADRWRDHGVDMDATSLTYAGDRVQANDARRLHGVIVDIALSAHPSPSAVVRWFPWGQNGAKSPD